MPNIALLDDAVAATVLDNMVIVAGLLETYASVETTAVANEVVPETVQELVPTELAGKGKPEITEVLPVPSTFIDKKALK